MVHSQRKGAAGEREAAAELRRLFGVAARRGRQFCGSPESPDVVTDLDGVHFEIKRCEALRLYAALEQAIADARHRIPVVLHRQNNKPWVAIVRLDDLPSLAALLQVAQSETTQP
jgi:Holliday junction resolvase